MAICSRSTGGLGLRIEKIRKPAALVCWLVIAVSVSLSQEPASPQPPAPPSAQPANDQGPAAAQAPTEVPGGAPLRVMVGKSLLINTTERIKRVSVTDPAVADPF